MGRRFFRIVAFGFILLLCRPEASVAQLAADWVLLNGKILTANTEDPADFTVAEAVAIYDGKFVVVGTNQEALAAAGPNTRRVDLGGRTMLPGLVETHIHVHNHTRAHQLRNEILPGMTDREIEWKSKAEGMAQLPALAQGKAAGEWIVVPVAGEGDLDEGDELAGAPTRAELDQLFPGRPVSLVLADRFAIVNSRALDLLLERYPNGVPEIVEGADGQPTGFLRNAAARTMSEFYPALTPGRVEELAPFYRKELEEPAARGVTTLSSRMDSVSLRMYQLLAKRGEMPVRMAYGDQSGTFHPLADTIYFGAPQLAGVGHPWLWNAGISPGPQDRGGPIGCLHKPYPENDASFPQWRGHPYGPHGGCLVQEDSVSPVLRGSILGAARNGFSLIGTHMTGDRTMDDYLDLLEQADRESGGISGRRFSIDHCYYLSEQQAQRAARLGVSPSCQPPAPLNDAEKTPYGAYRALYGREVAADVVTPFRRMVRLGMKPAIHCENHRAWDFACMQYAITRKDKKDGSVWGPQQRINRREALYGYTRWAAWHVHQEDMVGSIEPGKWADLVVIDKDYLEMDEDQIAQINPLLTIVGGKITYSEPNFAASLGLPAVGFRAPANWWNR